MNDSNSGKATLQYVANEIPRPNSFFLKKKASPQKKPLYMLRHLKKNYLSLLSLSKQNKLTQQSCRNTNEGIIQTLKLSWLKGFIHTVSYTVQFTNKSKFNIFM